MAVQGLNSFGSAELSAMYDIGLPRHLRARAVEPGQSMTVRLRLTSQGPVEQGKNKKGVDPFGPLEIAHVASPLDHHELRQRDRLLELARDGERRASI